MERGRLQGVWTALITPFNEDQTIDYGSLDNLIKLQIEAGVTGILVNGTTGESPTLEDDEVEELIRFAKERTNGKCLLMVGTGTNCTKKSISKTVMAESAGADLVMLVNPYYSKPTQDGMYLHFKTVAESTSLPVLIYNIKGRTGVNLETNTLMQLIQDTPNIVGVKEASGDLEQISTVCTKRPKHFAVLSGDDNVTNTIVQNFGADGVISVASNIVPKHVVEMVKASMNKEWSKAEEINESLQGLFTALFVETNPIPVKYAASKMGLCKNIFRLPMCPISEKNAVHVDDALQKLGR